MQPFAYERAGDQAEAVQRGAAEPGTAFIAGGTDLMQLMKDDVARPSRLVDIDALPLDFIEADANGLRLGALARMADVADHAAVQEHYPVIAQALLASASPQVRNMASMGGNLLQRTRCTYFRDTASACNKRAPGSGCSARQGINRVHAILGGSDQCVATHASDLAVALVALDARLDLVGPQGTRELALADFHLLPGSTPERETQLLPGELITAIRVPASPVARRSAYLKVRDRASFEFALASAAVALAIEDGTIRDARVAAGGVGTKPWRLPDVERALIGAPARGESYRAAAAEASAGARPLTHNGFKLPLLQNTVERALRIVGEQA
jgi:xanthine dehydrogenase YagS FAD-binding subunit